MIAFRKITVSATGCRRFLTVGLCLLVVGLCLLDGGVILSADQSSADDTSSDTSTTEDSADYTDDDIGLEGLLQIVITPSKHSQTTSEAPSSVSVITSDDIRKFGYRSLSDILRGVRGFHTSYDRTSTFLGARGIARDDFNSRILLLVNGHRVNNNLSDSASIGNGFLLDVDLIDRVEVVRGPGAALYGNNAFFGVLNVVTRTGADMRQYGTEISGEYARFDTYKGRLTYGNHFGENFEMLISGNSSSSEGQDHLVYPEFSAINNGVARGRDSEDYSSGFARIRFYDFTLEGGFVDRDKADPTAKFLTRFNEAQAGIEEERYYVNLKFEHEFSEFMDVMAQVYYDRYEIDVGQPTGTVVNREEQIGEWAGAEIQVSKEIADKHILTLGGEYRNDFRQDRKNFDVDPYFVFAEDDRDRRNFGFFAQVEVELHSNLHLNSGVRFDDYDTFGSTTNPRLALIYNPTETSVIKAIYGTAFRAPNFIETIDRRSILDADPETIRSYELVYEQAIGRNLRTTLAGFYNEVDDLIGFQDGAYRNLEGEANAYGFEFEIAGRWAETIQTRLSYSYQETEDTSTGDALQNAPQHLGKFHLSFPLYHDKVFAGIEVLLLSERETIRQTTLPGYGIINLTLFSHELIEGLEISASVYNLLDREFDDPATSFHRQESIEQDGRVFRAKLIYRF